MNRKKLFIRIATLIFLIFVFNALALWLHWYSALLWLDIPMHILGGFWLGLFFIWLFSFKEIEVFEDFLNKKNFKFFLKILFFVLIIGILWEVFEFMINESITRNLFDTIDTFSDLVFDLLGAIFSIYYVSKKIVSKLEKI